jgi:hypothetical protein
MLVWTRIRCYSRLRAGGTYSRARLTAGGTRPAPPPGVPICGFTTCGIPARPLAALIGATLKELMDRLGHSSPQAALRYQHVAAGRSAEIAALLSNLADA